MRARNAHIGTFQRSDTDGIETSGTPIVAEPERHEETWQLWVTPDRRRARFEVRSETVDVVIEGSTFWSNGNGRSITNGGNPNVGHGQGDGQHLVCTSAYANVLSVMDFSEGTRLGRRTIDALVRVVDDDRHRTPILHGLTVGDVEALELSIDRERGVVLRAVSMFQGIVYRIVQATSVNFDPVFGPEIFHIEPRFDAEWVLAN